MLEKLITSILTNLASKLFAWVLEYFKGKQKQSNTNEDIDQRLDQVKQAYKEAFNGEPVTPEQRKRLNQSLADFIRNTNNGGM